MIRHGFPSRSERSVIPWIFLAVGLALVFLGCSKEAGLSKNAQAMKQQLQGEINTVTAALAGPVAQQDWDAVITLLKPKLDEIKKRGDVPPASIVVLDKNAITQARYPDGEHKQGLDFMNYQPAQLVFKEKKRTQAQLYLGDKKIYIALAPILQQNEVIGGVALGFPEEALKAWKVPEQDFLDVDLNQ